MTVATVITAFQTLHDGITGVALAPTKLPASLDRERLPLAFTWPGPSVEGGGWIAYPGWHQTRRYYIVRVYVASVAQRDTGVDPGYQAALPLLEAFGAAYMANQNLGGVVAHIGPLISDSGIVVLEYAGNSYTGLEFRVEVSEKGPT